VALLCAPAIELGLLVILAHATCSTLSLGTDRLVPVTFSLISRGLAEAMGSLALIFSAIRAVVNDPGEWESNNVTA